MTADNSNSPFYYVYGGTQDNSSVGGPARTRNVSGIINADWFNTQGGDGIIKLAFSVKEQYWANARYVLNRFSLRDIRLLKDTANNYLWQPAADGIHGLSTGLPATLYGYPYTIAVDYPTAASNAFTVSFGDHKRAYWIVDRIELQYLRDPFTQASAGAVVIHARKRVGGQVVLPEAINVLKMA